MTLSSRYLVDAESIRRAQRGLKLAVEVGLDLADHIGCIHGAIDPALALELASGPGIAGEEDLVASLDARHFHASSPAAIRMEEVWAFSSASWTVSGRMMPP